MGTRMALFRNNPCRIGLFFLKLYIRFNERVHVFLSYLTSMEMEKLKVILRISTGIKDEINTTYN